MKDLAFDHWDDLTLMVVQENNRQLEKWGNQDEHPYGWMTWLTEEVGELAAAIGDQIERGEATDAEIAKEAIQVATLALKIAEMHLYRAQSEASEEDQICLQCKGEGDPDPSECADCSGEEID